VLHGYEKDAEAGRAPADAELIARYPHLAAELAQALADRRRFGALFGSFRATSPHAPAATVALPASFGDYEVLEELGRGGMGWSARRGSEP
jgi:hypothetical protein